MNICKSEIYFVILLIIIFYLNYSNKNKEGFQSSSTTTGYQADIEAIRNLSSIATQLTTSNKLTMPGALTVTNDLTVGGHTYIGKDKNFILDGDNKWIFHTPDDGRKILYLAPWNGKDDWDWSKQFTIDNNGNVSSAGNISSAQGHKIGNSWDGVSSSITDSKYDTNSLCIVGQGTSPNRKVTMWDKVQIYGTFCIGGTCIDETHLQMLTGARAMQFYHENGTWENNMNLRYVHVASDAKIVKWTNGANFKLFKN
jgi:hypothetical protein